MEENKWKKFIENAKNEYYQIGSISCPAFGGEQVYFTKQGINHLLYKEGKLRSFDGQYRRIKLLPFAIETIKISTKIASRDGKFYTLLEKINGITIKVIIIKENSKLLLFLSVMNK